ncbi:MAG: ATP-binding cassette domain-containing protein [Chloroflexi bacterium]|nr:ATP-binding cassette domain-containing protein [Chloroflexota bacterium]
MPLSVIQVVMQGRIRGHRWLRRLRPADIEIAEQALRQAGLWSHRGEPMASLSRGQQQRVFLARSLAQGADILLLDETFSGVDIRSKESLMEILHTLRDQGRTILLASHAVDQVEKNCDCCLCLNRGVVGFGRTRDLVEAGVIRNLVGTV